LAPTLVGRSSAVTHKYWIRIFVGIAVIFVVGSLVTRAGKALVSRGKTMVRDHFPSSMPLLATGFRTEDGRVGNFRRVQFMRSTPGRVDSVVLTVALDSGEDVSQFKDCALRATSAHPFNGSTRFVCTDADDSAHRHLMPFGHVAFTGNGPTIPLYVSRDVYSDVNMNAYRGQGSDEAGDVDITNGNGEFSLTVNGQTLVRASGDSNGGSLTIRDSHGHPIVQINGDSNGGAVKVMDAQGHTKVDVHGKGDH
jgi:hypothetical protein